MKLVHAADLHLDSPLLGLSRYPGAPVDRIRDATRRAFGNLVSLCIDEGAKLLVLAGDLYDGEWKDYATGLYFASELSRLREASVRVVWIRGNHDAASLITKYQRLRLPDNTRELAVDRAETVCFESLGVAVHGRGFATRAVTENLAQSYPERVPGLLNLGLLHTSLTGRAGHEPYAPCTLDGLRSLGYDYWALGHVHAREVLSDAPWIVFSGNLQGRHVREAGDKGATLVTYDAHGISAVEHRALDVVRFAEVAIDLGSASDADAALELVRARLATQRDGADGRMLALRLSLEGASPAHAALRADSRAFEENVRALATDVGGDDLWIEKLAWRTKPVVERATLQRGDGALAELARAIDALRADDAALVALAETELAQLVTKLPAEARDGDDGVRVRDPKYLAAQLDDVEALLFDKLLGVAERP